MFTYNDNEIITYAHYAFVYNVNFFYSVSVFELSIFVRETIRLCAERVAFVNTIVAIKTAATYTINRHSSLSASPTRDDLAYFAVFAIRSFLCSEWRNLFSHLYRGGCFVVFD